LLSKVSKGGSHVNYNSRTLDRDCRTIIIITYHYQHELS